MDWLRSFVRGRRVPTPQVAIPPRPDQAAPDHPANVLLVFVQTHFAFPIHGYPSDYWRYTRDALGTIFGADAGLRIIGSAYQYPVALHAPELPPPDSIEAYLNTCVVAEKPLGDAQQ